MKRSGEVCNERDPWRYLLGALTEHQPLSSRTEEWENKAGRKISIEPDDLELFFAMNLALGIRRTPKDSQRICSG